MASILYVWGRCITREERYFIIQEERLSFKLARRRVSNFQSSRQAGKQAAGDVLTSTGEPLLLLLCLSSLSPIIHCSCD